MRGAERSHQHGKASPVENAFRAAFAKRLNSARRAQVEAPFSNAGKGGLPGEQVDAVGMREILRYHGPVESHEPSRIGEASQQGCNVAVPDENLGVSDDLLRVQFIQQIIRSVATPSTHNRPYIVALEHLL